MGRDRRGAVAKVPGRILHAACGDGWLVRLIDKAGGDAYGVDPRAHQIDRAELGVLDLRGEDIVAHLRAVAPAGLGALVLSGLVDGLDAGSRAQLLTLVGTCLAPGGTLVLHSALAPGLGRGRRPATRPTWPPGRPLRPEAWCRLFESMGYEAVVHHGPAGADYLVIAVRAGVVSPYPPAER